MIVLRSNPIQSVKDFEMQHMQIRRWGLEYFICLSSRESIDLFQELADIFSNDNNQILSRELLMKVRCILYAKVTVFISPSWNSC